MPMTLIATLVSLAVQGAEPPAGGTVVFASRALDPAALHDNCRIPAVARTPRGVLLAFAEGRSRDTDQAGNDLVLRRSADAGVTWEPMRIIADRGAESLNNPQVVVLEAPWQVGRVVLMYQSYPAGVHEFATDAPQPRLTRTWIMSSDDEGATWSDPREISDAVTPDRAATIATGPGNAVQLRAGPHAGRLVEPCNSREGKAWSIFAAYSDDGGETWRHGAKASHLTSGYPNEVQAVELADGSVLFNCRLQSGKARHRGVSVSRDAGETLSAVAGDERLIDPVCMASIIRLVEPGERDCGTLVFSNPATRDRRQGGLVRFSDDDGRTWPTEVRIGSPTDAFAYSALVRLDDRRVGCLYETTEQGNAAIKFAVVERPMVERPK